jgi:aminomethyltransferase
MAYVPAELANAGQQIQIDVRGRMVGARVVPVPFYKREKK